MDAHSWLDAHRPALLVEEPRRLDVEPEKLVGGDVRADGNIVDRFGCVIVCGPVWVTPEQAHNAAYYGWDRLGNCVSRDPKDSRIIIVVSRDMPLDFGPNK